MDLAANNILSHKKRGIISQYLLYLYIFFIPLMKLPKPIFMGDKLQYCDLIFIPLCIIFVIKLFQRQFKLAENSIALFLIIFLFVPTLSLLNSPFKNDVYLDTLGMAYLILVYVALTNLIEDEKMLARINITLLVSTCFVSSLGIIFFVLYNFFNANWLLPFMYGKVADMQTALLPFYRSTSLLSLPEMFVNFALLGLACMFIYRDKQRQKQKKAAINFCIVGTILAVLLAFCRSFIGILLLFLALTFLSRKKSLILYFIFWASMTLFIFLFLYAGILWFYTIAPISFSLDKNSGIAQVTFNANPDTRFYLAKAGLAMGNRHPLLGSGLGSFTNNFSKFLSRRDLHALAARRLEAPNSLRIDPHSLYFGAIAEIGWVGMAVLLCFFSLVLLKLWRASRLKYADTHPATPCYIFFFSILGYLINGLFVDVLSMRSLWITLSLGVAYANISVEETGKR